MMSFFSSLLFLSLHSLLAVSDSFYLLHVFSILLRHFLGHFNAIPHRNIGLPRVHILSTFWAPVLFASFSSPIPSV